MLRLGLSTCYFKEKTPAEWESVKAAGITDIEISMNCPLDCGALLILPERLLSNRSTYLRQASVISKTEHLLPKL